MRTLRFDEFWFAAFIILVMILLTFAPPAEAQDVKGCLVTFLNLEGQPKPFYEPFLKVADKPYDSEEGDSEIWGYYLDAQKLRALGVEPDGKVKPVNVKEELFIPANRPRIVNFRGRAFRCRCPPNIPIQTASN